MNERPPPVVTVTDPTRALPSRPAPDTAGRHRRRPGAAVLTLLAAVALVIGLSRLQQPGRPQAAPGRPGLELRTDAVSGSDHDSHTELDVRLRGRGAFVVIRDVRVGAAGWSVAMSLPTGLPVGSDATARLSHAWTCRASDAVPRSLLVTVDAGRGRRTLRLPISRNDEDLLEQLRAGTCGSLSAGAALGLGRTSVALQGDHLLVEAELENRSTVPVVLRSAAVSGVVVTGLPAFPRVLPARAAGSPAGPSPATQVRFSLRSGPCRAATGPPADAEGAVGLDVVLDGRGGRASSRLLIDGLTELVARLRSEHCGAAHH